ncbi:hypothetical protein PC121_g15941 [Phytophthora cactorum]|nr:hypothetical protein PC121_g15941 [Phytophthora cactorum]
MLLPFLDTEDEAIAELLPFAAPNRRLRDLLGELKDVESVSKALQGFTVGNSPSPIDAFNPLEPQGQAVLTHEQLVRGG